MNVKGGVTCVCTGKGRKQNACPARGGNAAMLNVCAPIPSPLTHAATAPKGTSFRCWVLSSQAIRRACPPLRPDTTKNETCSWDSKRGTRLPSPCKLVSPPISCPPLPSPSLPPDVEDIPSSNLDSLPRYLSIVTVTLNVSSGS